MNEVNSNQKDMIDRIISFCSSIDQRSLLFCLNVMDIVHDGISPLTFYMPIASREIDLSTLMTSFILSDVNH